MPPPAAPGPGRASGAKAGSAAHAASANVDPGEVARFAAQAAHWWDPEGVHAPLHRLNPARLTFIRDRLCARFGRDALSLSSLQGLRVVDIGCGGGLVCEPLARLGAEVTGIDAGEETVAVASAHAEGQGLDIDYRATTAEALAAEGARFDVVLALEIVEHVPDAGAFLQAAASLVAPGGALIASTLNRTARSYALAIVGAEYVLRWVPRGTHDWRRFVKPSELARHLRAAGLDLAATAGLVLDPLSGEWRLDPRDLAVNYIAMATRASAE